MRVPCLQSSGSDLEWQGWLGEFVFLNDPQSLPSSGITAVWVVVVLPFVILVLLEWSVSS